MQSSRNLASRPAEVAGTVTLRNFIAGDWAAPGVELSNDVTDSNTGAVIIRQRGSTPAQIATAVECADAAHRSGAWSGMRPQDRADALTRIGGALDDVAEEIAHSDARSTGVPIVNTRTLATVCGAAFRTAAALTVEPDLVQREANFEVQRLPLGPAAIIAPWNAPAGIACHKLASALAAGCPVLYKPSEWAPLSGQRIAEVIARVGLPNGVFQLLHGDGVTGGVLTSDARVASVSFTGGLEAGRAVAVACAQQIKPAQLELGGNNPLIVLPGADLDAAVEGIVTALTTLNGQWCRALGRLLVHKTLVDDVLEATLRRLENLRVGSSLDEATEMGPVVHEQHRQLIAVALDTYRKKGGVVHMSGKLPGGDGWFVLPALVTGLAPEDALDEVFGPVATVHEFDSVAEAVQLANMAPYGLAAYVFGGAEDAYEVARQLESGTVKINQVTLFSPHPEAPRPAWKLSGIGEEGTHETFEFFRGSRVIGVPQGIPG